MEYYVYQLRRADSALPFYIGKGKGERRFAHFRPSQMKVRSWKNSAIRSSMQDGVEVLAEILEKDLSEESALTKEQELIAKYGRRDNATGILTNMTDGGEAPVGRVMSARELQALKERMKTFRHTPEARAKISKAGIGRSVSLATRAKMSASGLGGPPHTADAKLRISAGQKALPKSPCVHCGKELTVKHMAQWHGDKCKKKVEVNFANH